MHFNNNQRITTQALKNLQKNHNRTRKDKDKDSNNNNNIKSKHKRLKKVRHKNKQNSKNNYDGMITYLIFMDYI